MNRPPLIVAIPLVIACLAAAHMAASVIYAVVLRYVFNTPTMSEVVDLDFTWAVMLGCGAALVWRHAPTAALLSGGGLRPWQRILGCIVAAVSAVCFAALALLALRLLNESIATAEVSIGGQPMWEFRLAPVVGFGLAALILVAVAIVRLRSTPSGDRAGAP
jgi:TRAP-type C4-dicarboxylate transport system permease small subunit